MVELNLWDAADGGGEDYYRLRPLSYPDTDIFLLCFAVDNLRAFENVPKEWAPEVRHFCPDVPIMVVGTKKDLRDDQTALAELEVKGQKPVSEEEGRAMAERIGAVAYVECSAKTKDGVREVFETAAKEVLQRRAQKNKKKSRKCRVL
nr:hypothetical protein BaRGS_026200 [Batillaria attramentaria]